MIIEEIDAQLFDVVLTIVIFLFLKLYFIYVQILTKYLKYNSNKTSNRFPTLSLDFFKNTKDYYIN